MAEVELTLEARTQLAQVPRTVQRRMRNVFVRLTRWPHVSGVKRLKGELKGSFRIRSGDYRIVFNVIERKDDIALLTVWKIGYRGDVYD
jgi:mRNA-degrading endonuclease RelE of RelBE toxin-antitoxin system